jgi:hypothetical protein
MSFTVFDQIVGDLALGQQGIGGNIFALNIDGVKQRDGGFDFVGAFDFVILYGQGRLLFLGVAGFALMTDCAHDVSLIALIVDGVAHGFSINGQRFVLLTIGLTPAL